MDGSIGEASNESATNKDKVKINVPDLNTNRKLKDAICSTAPCRRFKYPWRTMPCDGGRSISRREQRDSLWTEQLQEYVRDYMR